jgi:deazaflavin-dependent oxidoreductase (nitroreductase family)
MSLTMRAFGALHSGLYRLSGGRIGGRVGKAPILLLSTVGRKSGQARTLPLGYARDAKRLLVVASALGAAKHPAWYLNLRDNPRVTVSLGGEARQMVAQTAIGEERARLWAQLIADFPHFVEHQRKTPREIPIVILDEVKG